MFIVEKKLYKYFFVYLLFFFVSILNQTKQALTGPNVKYQLLTGLPITSAPILAQSKCVRYSKTNLLASGSSGSHFTEMGSRPSYGIKLVTDS